MSGAAKWSHLLTRGDMASILNDRGEVIGVARSKLKGASVDRVGFAIPISFAYPLLAIIPDYKFNYIGKKTKRLSPAQIDAAVARGVILIVAIK